MAKRMPKLTLDAPRMALDHLRESVAMWQRHFVLCLSRWLLWACGFAKPLKSWQSGKVICLSTANEQEEIMVSTRSV